MQTLENFFWVKTAVRVRNLQISKIRSNKIITPIQTEFFQFLSSLCTCLWDINGLKKHSAVSKSGYLYGLNQNVSLTNAFVFF